MGVDDPPDRRPRGPPDLRQQLLGRFRRREGVHDEHAVPADDEAGVADGGAVSRLRDRREDSVGERDEREMRRPRRSLRTATGHCRKEEPSHKRRDGQQHPHGLILASPVVSASPRLGVPTSL